MHTTVCEFLLDIIQNSLEADSSVIIVEVNQVGRNFEVTVGDDGCGMDEQQLKSAQDPFYSQAGKHDHRKAGLGIPFLMQTAELTGGECSVKSEKGKGTSVKFVLPLDHVDTPPIGDLPGTFLASLSYPGDYEMVIRRHIETEDRKDSYQLVRSQLKEALGEIETSGALAMLRDYLISQEETAETQMNDGDNYEKEARHGKNDPRRTEGITRTEEERIK